MVIQNKFNIGEIVYLKTDKEQTPRIVFAIKVMNNDYLYELACGTSTSSHYDFELSAQVDILLTTNN